MGTFLQLSGVAMAQCSEIEAILEEYAVQNEGVLEPVGVGDEGETTLAIGEAANGTVTIVYPWDFPDAEGISSLLSAALHQPVFYFHIHDDDLWMYVLYVNGKEVDSFNTVPDYFGSSDVEQAALWAGDVTTIVRYWPNVTESDIVNYLVPWEGREGIKAYANDQHTVGDPWQLFDFMAKWFSRQLDSGILPLESCRQERKECPVNCNCAN